MAQKSSPGEVYVGGGHWETHHCPSGITNVRDFHLPVPNTPDIHQSFATQGNALRSGCFAATGFTEKPFHFSFTVQIEANRRVASYAIRDFPLISSGSGGGVGRIIIISARDVITVRARPREFASLFPHTEGEAGPPWEATFLRQIFRAL